MLRCVDVAFLVILDLFIRFMCSLDSFDFLRGEGGHGLRVNRKGSGVNSGDVVWCVGRGFGLSYRNIE